nr:tetratricopeptide repeat protein [Treponema pallidum]
MGCECSVPPFETGKRSVDAERIMRLSWDGYAFLKVNDLERAESEFGKILQIEADNNYALVGLGDAARKRRAYQEASDYYTRCLQHYPRNSYALFGLADCYKNMRRYVKAVEMWQQYLEQDSHNIAVLTRMADAYRKIHDFQNSRNLYSQVIALDEHNSYALIGLAHLHYDFKKYREALIYWKKLLECAEHSVDIRVLTSIGNCYRKMKLFSQGLPYFQEALKRDPGNFYGFFGMADCYRGMNMQERSIQYWEKILEKDTQNRVILTRIADAYRHIGEYEKAHQTYKRALDIDYDAYATLGLAVLCKLQGRYEEAVVSLDRLVQLDRKNYRVYVELADCYRKLGQKQKALETLRLFQQFGVKNRVVSELMSELEGAS